MEDESKATQNMVNFYRKHYNLNDDECKFLQQYAFFGREVIFSTILSTCALNLKVDDYFDILQPVATECMIRYLDTAVAAFSTVVSVDEMVRDAVLDARATTNRVLGL